MAYEVTNQVEAVIPFRRAYDSFRLPRHFRGGPVGRLAGSAPDGQTTIEGAPVSAYVRILLRTVSGHPGDGALVAEVVSNPDGTWEVTGLPANMRFDVVGRHPDHNDVIVANVAPEVV